MNSNFKKNELKMKDRRAKSKIIQQSPLQRNAAAGSWLLVEIFQYNFLRHALGGFEEIC